MVSGKRKTWRKERDLPGIWGSEYFFFISETRGPLWDFWCHTCCLPIDVKPWSLSMVWLHEGAKYRLGHILSTVVQSSPRLQSLELLTPVSAYQKPLDNVSLESLNIALLSYLIWRTTIQLSNVVSHHITQVAFQWSRINNQARDVPPVRHIILAILEHHCSHLKDLEVEILLYLRLKNAVLSCLHYLPWDG